MMMLVKLNEEFQNCELIPEDKKYSTGSRVHLLLKATYRKGREKDTISMLETDFKFSSNIFRNYLAIIIYFYLDFYKSFTNINFH